MTPHPEQIEHLLNAFLEESLTDSEAAQLRAALADDPVLACRLAGELEWEVLLRNHFASSLVSADCEESFWSRRHRATAFAIAASAAILLFLWFLFQANPLLREPDELAFASRGVACSFRPLHPPRADAAFTTAPSRSQSETLTLPALETPRNRADNYETRLTGWLRPPVTGDYLFWVSADDSAEFLLSSDDNPAHVRKILLLSNWTPPDVWDRSPEQRSTRIRLQAGRNYYFEARHLETTGGDHLQIAWTPPRQPRAIIGTAALRSKSLPR